LTQSFPWLSAFASQFDHWEPQAMVAVFESTTSNYSGTGSLGTVVLATEYDVMDPPYESLIEIENSQYAVSGNASQHLMHAIECKKQMRQPFYFVRAGAVPSNDNVRFYDFANLQIATQGFGALQNIGRIWITYTIKLSKTQVFGGLIGRDRLSFIGESTGATAAAPFGTMVRNANNTMDVSFSLTDMTFPDYLNGATFLVMFTYVGTSTAITAPTVVCTSGCNFGPQINLATSSVLTSQGTTTTMFVCYTVNLTGGFTTPQTVTLTSGTYPTGTAVSYLTITQINPNL
jgi:hypothetical protein